ncbi:MAG: ATP-binding protein [Planctomycetota bacterium]
MITNALKHGFPPHRGGRLRVTLAVEGDRTCLLAVADDGVGMPEHFDPLRPRGLGLRMVRALTRQLDGHLGHSATPGAVFEVRFPRPAARDSSVQPGPGRA